MLSKTLLPTIGVLHLMWTTHEVLLEMHCMKLLGISKLQSHIVFSSLNYSAKKEIAISLTREAGLENGASIILSIRKIGQLASRNHIFHSIIGASEDRSVISFTQRSITNGLRPKSKTFTTEAFLDHVENTTDEIIRLQKLCGFSNEDYYSYTEFDAVPA